MPQVLNEIGSIFTITPAAVGAGTNFTTTLDLNFRSLPHAITFRIVTDANVANRYPGISCTFPTGEAFIFMPATAITASLTTNVYLLPGLGTAVSFAANRYCSGLPTNFYVPPGTVIASFVANIQAGDQISLQAVVMRRWADSTT